MIPELCVVKYQSVTKSDSHCIIKSGCKIRHSNGILSSDELPDNDKRKTTRLAPCEEKTKWSNMRIKDVYRSRLRPIEQPKPRINGTSKYVYRKRKVFNNSCRLFKIFRLSIDGNKKIAKFALWKLKSRH